ncbi:EamA domain-containing membrane protein RarD [Aquabacterium commune]|uniref:EamA domain-containing membrane protein RarD n=1 Tax=Aquabacterium commune TaxID=70586 RepID=A0A4R6R604_9BURK|nr:DMT family transporter [Aquabacterium commune]TDP81343.1 EamA domain-containing membrane protein RarD [Aquabacterium commune]
MPYLGLLFNAFVWGLSWWPLRQLQAMGLHAVWATMLFFLMGVLVVGVTRREAWSGVWRTPTLWVLALATGATNAAFNWGVATGEVVRVVLLFYLMPLWAVGLAWWLLGERITPMAAVRVLLALGGALLVLRPEDGGWPRFNGQADWLGLVGGLGFAVTNVMMRRAAQRTSAERALAMFIGGVGLPALAGLALSAQGLIPGWPAFDWAWLLLAGAMGVAFFAANLAMQYGASQIPVHLTSVVMLTEIVFASGSAVWFGGETLRPVVLVGGALILLAALMATRDEA